MAPIDGFDPDQPVIEAIRNGDRNAFEELVRRHGSWVRGIVFGVLGDRDRIDDVCQQVWSSAWQRIGKLRDTNLWRPWLYRLARNAAIDAGRDVTRQRKRVATLAEAPPMGAEAPPSPDGVLAGKETHREVLGAIQALPALYREPFVLRHLNGWSYRQIAEAMGMPTASIETRLVRARRLLQESLKDMMG